MEQSHHGVVVPQHVGRQALDSLRASDADQGAQQKSPNAAPLVIVVYGNGYLGRAGWWTSEVAAYAKYPLPILEWDEPHNCHIFFIIEFDKSFHLIGRQFPQ